MCEYCENEKKIELTSDSATSYWFIFHQKEMAGLYCRMYDSAIGNAYGIKINYCPMCGKKLREVKQ